MRVEIDLAIELGIKVRPMTPQMEEELEHIFREYENDYSAENTN